MDSKTVLRFLKDGDKIVQYATRPNDAPLIVMERGGVVSKSVFNKLQKDGSIEVVSQNTLTTRYGVKAQ